MKFEIIDSRTHANAKAHFRGRIHELRTVRHRKKLAQQRRSEFETLIAERMNVLERAWQRGDGIDTAYAFSRLRAAADEGASRDSAWWFARSERAFAQTDSAKLPDLRWPSNTAASR